MRITSIEEEGLIKVYGDNKYIGYVDRGELYAFNSDNQATWITHPSDTLSDNDNIISEYTRMNEHLIIIDNLIDRLTLYAPNSPVLEKAIRYLKKRGVR
jgi:hypothetical protein